MATDRTEYRLSKWADALVQRYGHPPTELEIVTDPLVKLAWSHDRVRASENQQKLIVLTKEVFSKRQRAIQK